MENIEHTESDLNELERQLDSCLYAYEIGQPLITDDEYDHYKRILKTLRPNSSFLRKIGNKPKKKIEKLPYILGSLTNKFEDDIKDWFKKRNNGFGYVLSHKLDGVAIEVEYSLGVLTNAWLRGDHIEGENITHKAYKFILKEFKTSQFNNFIPKMHFKGEALLNCEPETIGYKTKRNAVAGILNRDDLDRLKYLYFKFHTIIPTDYMIKQNINRESDRLAFMSLLVGSENVVRFEYVESTDDVINFAKHMIQEETQYDKDGIVITIDKSDVENVKLPENKIAFKFNKLSAVAEVEDIEWNVSRTGKIIPVVKIKPIVLGGATIQRASGFHAKFIYENDIGPGAVVQLVRSGDVIPYIEKIIKKSTTFVDLTKCPTCGHQPLTTDDTKTHLYCTNPNCGQQIQKQITYFFTKLGLENFSEKMISSLNCNTVLDVYNLKREDILKIEGWAETSTDDFLNRIREVKNSKPEKILAALGIDNLGETTAKLLLENFSANEILEALDDRKKLESLVYKMIQIKGLGKTKVKSIIDGLKENKSLLEQLMKIGISFNKPPVVGPLSKKSFCITGSLSKPRKAYELIIEKFGGTNVNISSCDFLICNNPSESNKFKKAQERGVKIITEDDLILMIRKGQ
jgi:DNA ligase (NAD+)